MVSADIGNHSCCRGFDRQRKGKSSFGHPKLRSLIAKRLGILPFPHGLVNVKFGRQEQS